MFTWGGKKIMSQHVILLAWWNLAVTTWNYLSIGHFSAIWAYSTGGPTWNLSQHKVACCPSQVWLLLLHRTNTRPVGYTFRGKHFWLHQNTEQILQPTRSNCRAHCHTRMKDECSQCHRHRTQVFVSSEIFLHLLKTTSVMSELSLRATVQRNH